jgi:OFA family oxalate/formate antiporter-like MFS transporter
VFGLGMGGVGALGPLAITEMYGLKNYGAIIGLTTPAMIVPMLVGPIMAGFIFDSTGSYVLAFQITLGLLMISMASFALAKPPRSPWSSGLPRSSDDNKAVLAVDEPGNTASATE